MQRNTAGTNRPRQHRLRGTAIVVALIFVVVISSLIGASLLYAQNSHKLAYTNARSEAALLLAEGGVNDELQYIASHLESTTVSGLSSQPTAANGETEIYPPDGFVVKGRKGSVDGQSGKFFWVYSSNDSAGTTAWDGRSSTFWVTSTAKVDGSWRRVKVQVQAVSIFSLHAIFALAGYTNNSNAVTMSAATVTITGTAGTNGTLTNGSSTLVASNILNANTTANPTGQFTASNLANGGQIYTRSTPYVYPTVSTVLKKVKNRTADTDAQAWTWIGTATNNSNNTGIYTYRSRPTSAAINSTNCEPINLGITTLTNSSGSTLAAWTNAGYKPGGYLSSSGLSISTVNSSGTIEITTTANHSLSTGQSVTITGVLGNTAANGHWTITKTTAKKFTLNGSASNGTYTSGGTVYTNEIQTLIFTPGDYYFTNVNLGYDYRTQIVIDPQAYASGGTPGQVRFWIHDPSNGVQNDSLSLPITTTLASGATSADPGGFRIYYSKDGKAFTLGRPSTVNFLDESTHALASLTGDFAVFGGIYAVTKLPTDTSALTGTQINFQGSTGNGGGTIALNGSLLADKISFQGPCSIVFVSSPNTSDPVAGAGITGGYSDGG